MISSLRTLYPRLRSFSSQGAKESKSTTQHKCPRAESYSSPATRCRLMISTVQMIQMTLLICVEDVASTYPEQTRLDTRKIAETWSAQAANSDSPKSSCRIISWTVRLIVFTGANAICVSPPSLTSKDIKMITGTSYLHGFHLTDRQHRLDYRGELKMTSTQMMCSTNCRQIAGTKLIATSERRQQQLKSWKSLSPLQLERVWVSKISLRTLTSSEPSPSMLQPEIRSTDQPIVKTGSTTETIRVLFVQLTNQIALNS